MFRRGGRLEPSSRRALAVLPVWIFCVIWMWAWWLDPERINFLPLFIPLSLALFYEFALLPTTFMYFTLKAKRPRRRIAPKDKKVAVISLCVPKKESMDIVERQLKAMSEITYPHDSWILDEGKSAEVKALARKYGVKYFSRKGIRKYNQDAPPFKAKTKAGNVNAWLEHVKRRKYDFFVQLDIDHVPKPNYLHKTLGYFRDADVAWVQAPSVYQNRNSWTARGAAEQELVLQGPLQMGFYGHSETPFIIGSHCTYRTSAVREIGGFQPTRAEDHLDTVMLASRGYRGVFLPEIIAEGDGPETLSTYLAQQFAWAYSMFQVLLHHTPELLKTMSFRKKWQFLFAQTWYPLWSLSYLVMFISPVIALIINREVAHMDGRDFLLHFAPLFACSFLVWWSARPLMQPKGVLLSWRGMILHAVRWPVVLRAVISAALKVKKPYMITPKGKFARQAPMIKTYRPFLFLGLISSLAVGYATIAYGQAALEAQIVFALTHALFMLIICFVDMDLHYRHVKPSPKQFKLHWLKPVSAVMTVATIFSLAFVTSPLVDYRRTSAILSRGTVAAAIPATPVPVPVHQMDTAQLVEQLKRLPANSMAEPPNYGLYDPTGSLRRNEPYIQHSFAQWQDSRYLAYQLYVSLRAGNTPLITLEPRGVEDGQKLLSDIATGQYDKRLEEINNILAATNRPVYVRFAHEMELYDLYPWGDQDPASYIRAYRHVVTFAKNQGVQNVKWVWSPAGNHGAEAYYPGDDAVDVIGTTVLHDQYWYSHTNPSFNYLERQRRWLQSYNKPVWIVEFGVGAADPAYQTRLIQEAKAKYQTYGYGAIIYLNIKDSNITGPDYRLKSSANFMTLFEKPKPAPETTPKTVCTFNPNSLPEYSLETLPRSNGQLLKSVNCQITLITPIASPP